MTKITKLTPEQEASIPAFRDEWIKLGESTEQADPKVMVEAVNQLYDAIGQPRVPVIPLISPYACVLAANMLRADPEADMLFGPQEGLLERMTAKLKGRKLQYEQAAEWGNHNPEWVAYATFFETIGHKYPEKLEAKLAALRNYHKNCGWLYCFEGCAFVSNRPTVLMRDEEGRLHNENGPAVAYADGYSFCAFHGTRIPAKWVENRKTIHPSEILKAENVEQRAAGAALIGWDRMLDSLPHKIVDSSVEPQIGDLIEVSLPGLPEPELFLKFVCPRNGPMMEGINKRQLQKPTLFFAHALHSRMDPRLYSFPQQRS